MSGRNYTRRSSIQSNKSDEIKFLKNLSEVCRQESKERINAKPRVSFQNLNRDSNQSFQNLNRDSILIQDKSNETTKTNQSIGKFYQTISHGSNPDKLNNQFSANSRNSGMTRSGLTDRSAANSFVDKYTNSSTSDRKRIRTSTFQAVQIRKSAIEKLGSLDNILDTNAKVLMDNVMGMVL